MLVLFDIDATLLKTQRAGLRAMQEAFLELWGRPCSLEGVHYAGRLDPLIFAEVLELNGVAAVEPANGDFRRAYRQSLERILAEPGLATPLAGARELVDLLADRADLILGLCTGNYEDTGRIKIRAAGLDERHFRANAFADEPREFPPHRRHLPPIAMAKAAAIRGRSLAAREVVVIGDTPADVDCARANGCRSIGVATGLHDLDCLRAAGADLATASLEDAAGILDFILGR
ncbi:MAG: HAD hydrolase-like protein [Planctomycetes bacterium]|nr:HAD hydrolase-like protein [Planctomycetota bacterium]